MAGGELPDGSAAALGRWIGLLGRVLEDGFHQGETTVAGPGAHDVADGDEVRVAADGQALAVAWAACGWWDPTGSPAGPSRPGTPSPSPRHCG